MIFIRETAITRGRGYFWPEATNLWSLAVLDSALHLGGWGNKCVSTRGYWASWESLLYISTKSLGLA